MAQNVILSTDTVRAALLTKVNGDLAELFDAIAAIAAGSAIVVSANDSTPGVLDGKLVAGSGITLTKDNGGGDETLTVAVKSKFASNVNGNPNISDTQIDVMATVTMSNTETFGPTGASVDHEWTALDDVPIDVDWVELTIYSIGKILTGTPNADMSQNVYAFSGSGSPGILNMISMCTAVVNADGDAGAGSVSSRKVSVSAGVIFKLRWSTTFYAGGTPSIIRMMLTGYGYN
jgi:hypothetical protein